MTKLITKNVLNMISNIPGIVGLASLDFSESSEKYELKDYNKAIDVVQVNSNEYDVKMSVICAIDVPIKTINKEITNGLTIIFKKAEKKLINTDIYIRGVE